MELATLIILRQLVERALQQQRHPTHHFYVELTTELTVRKLNVKSNTMMMPVL
jgi:hypothetical protein